jgi:hypothetical protein
MLENTRHDIKYCANILWATNFCVVLSSNANCFSISLVLRVFGRLYGQPVFSIASFTAAMYVLKSSILVAQIKQQSVECFKVHLILTNRYEEMYSFQQRNISSLAGYEFLTVVTKESHLLSCKTM